MEIAVSMGRMLVCGGCRTEFYSLRKKKFCGPGCWRRDYDRKIHRRDCVVCRKEFMGQRAEQRFCSRACDIKHRRGESPTSAADCRTCGSRFEFRSFAGRRSYFCGKKCREKSREKKRTMYLNAFSRLRRYRVKVTTVDKINPIEVFRRDNWRCYLCGFDVDRSAGKYDPLSPTVDHVIPISKGGEHTYDNVRCAHRTCNNRKSDQVL